MAQIFLPVQADIVDDDLVISEKDWLQLVPDTDSNPVIESTLFALEKSNLVQVNPEGIDHATLYIYQKLVAENYTPRTWRTHSLHLLPIDQEDPHSQWNKQVLNWIFLISSLNFSFWSDKEGSPERYGVEWKTSWQSTDTMLWTGYWSLVASINRALHDDDLPITDPLFYSSENLCPDSVLENMFRAAPQCIETIPLLKERIAIMRENGFILSNSFEGSFSGFVQEFHRRHNGHGTALDMVKMVTETFPSFRDEVYFEGQKVCLWKRAQILVAETWAAFYPEEPTQPHPIFPGSRGAEIHKLTMFADYRVPQILHHLNILSYPPSLVQTLSSGAMLPYGSREEVSLRAASIVAVERLRDGILRLIQLQDRRQQQPLTGTTGVVSSVIIDFFLWDLAKRVERSEETIEGMQTAAILPPHRTRSIWY